ncbi:zinc-dependent alcohol dehydrogenase family protein [Ramlibacter sp.]|uniref:zinc-dependent alcohol dehydrogenase family protein n=1 Tax=Ramlibacter sp. TaxID=1917967 RepID=UPI0017A32C5A|nr:zinc-dependent alcohol dehydrogenase family protein [Ramlibacter sp.]MBA2673885.1 zinc-dependent alcohol dehydrogenase family protein [Ramlibacter sp.]
MYQRAIVHAFGQASEVVALEMHAPGPLPADHVRVRMTARSINPSDLITISGAYRSRTPLPFIPGFEGVGVVEELGSGVTTLRPGARVVPIGSAGAWQEVKDCPAAWCLEVPDGVADAQAAASYVNPMTAWAILHAVAKVRPGMRIAVTAAGSAIGQMLVVLANRAGLHPVALVRSEAAARNVAHLCAQVVRYAAHGGLQELGEEWPQEQAVDAIFDCVGGSDAVPLARLLRPGGMFVHYGLLSGQPIPQAFWAGRRDIDFTMFHLRAWVREVPLAEVHRTYAETASLIAQGAIGTRVRASYPLAAIRAALADASTTSAEGKVLIVD